MWLWYRSGLVRLWSKSGLGESQRRGLHVGQVFSLTRTFSERDVELFSVLTGDTNPIHLDPDFIRNTDFHKPVVHGVLVNGLVSALLGAQAPGCVLLKQDLRFPAPVFTDEPVLAQAQVQRLKLFVALVSVSCRVRERLVLEGTVSVRIHRLQQPPSQTGSTR